MEDNDCKAYTLMDETSTGCKEAQVGEGATTTACYC